MISYISKLDFRVDPVYNYLYHINYERLVKWNVAAYNKAENSMNIASLRAPGFADENIVRCRYNNITGNKHIIKRAIIIIATYIKVVTL